MGCKIIINKNIISEDRIKDNPHISYKDVDRKGNWAATQDKVTKVIVTLSGGESQKVTKLIKQYKRIEVLIETLKQQQEKIKNRLRINTNDLTDAEDIVVTRVLRTCSATLDINAAKSKDGMTTSKTVSYSKVIDELVEKLTPELQIVLQELIEANTKITVRPPSMSMKLNNESINEGFLDKLKDYYAKFKNIISKWATKYDKKLDALMKEINAIEEITEDQNNVSLSPLFVKTKESREALSKIIQLLSNKDISPADRKKIEQDLKDINSKIDSSLKNIERKSNQTNESFALKKKV